MTCEAHKGIKPKHVSPLSAKYPSPQCSPSTPPDNALSLPVGLPAPDRGYEPIPRWTRKVRGSDLISWQTRRLAPLGASRYEPLRQRAQLTSRIRCAMIFNPVRAPGAYAFKMTKSQSRDVDEDMVVECDVW